VVVGTTDTPVDKPSLEPRAMDEEIDFLLTHAARYLTKDPEPEDVLSVFAGLRPLVKMGDSKDTASLSRDHTLLIDPSGLITITGGKWTTYRKMAEDTINEASIVAGLDERKCVTKKLRLHGWLKNAEVMEPYEIYGSDAPALFKIEKEDEHMKEKLHPRMTYRKAEVIWAVRNEMARTVEDVLSRRTRAILLDARASIDAAPDVAALMAQELGKNQAWIDEQIKEYTSLAKEYLLTE